MRSTTMPHPRRRMRWRAALQLGLGAALAATATLALAQASARPLASPATAFPQFEAAPCCQLCPTAYDRRAYTTKFLQGFLTLVQGRDGWLFRSEDDLRTDFGADTAALRALRRLHDTLAARGIELVVMLQPPRGLMHKDELPPDSLYNPELAQFSYVRTLQELRATGIVVPEFERLVYEGGRQTFYFRDDHHWRPEGARRMAEVVADRVREMPVYAELPKKEFVTSKIGLFGKRGTMSKAAQQLCGFGAPEQYVAQYATVPADDGGGDALFGEEAAPPVTLLGTSNSEPVYNFAGFLQEFLKVDVLNASVIGGGLDGSMLSYFGSKEYRESPPRILLWEIAPYHNLSDRQFYRQAIPMVDGGCDTRPAVLADARELKTGRNEVLFNGGGTVRALRGGEHVLDLRFNEPPADGLDAVVWYTNGRSEKLRVEESSIEGGRRYVFELRSEHGFDDYTFLSLDVNVDPTQAAPLHLQARLCREHAPATVASGRGA